MANRARASPPDARNRSITGCRTLATRVLSMDAYWQALRTLKGRPPTQILIPLWPGESLQQYEREFLRWLAAGRLSLADLREDRITERKYRLQFAETRVGRPSSNTQRATLSSRMQSRSRSPPSPRKRFGSAQQRIRASNSQSRSSRDRGKSRILTVRQSTDRPRHDQSYAPRNAQTDRYTYAHDARRSYDNRQTPYSAHLRHGQDSRAPPPRDVHRQCVTQHWKHSRSRSPQFHTRAASPLHNDNPFPHERRSPSSHDQARLYGVNLRRQMLAKRVVSLKVFKDEINKRQNGLMRDEDLQRPHETMVRIPVILWSDETIAQYTQNFERWLESRGLSLVLLRDHPAKERSLWYSFAYTRAGTPELAEPGTRSRSRSRSRSASRHIPRSPIKGRPSVLSTFAEKNVLESSNIESRKHSSRKGYSPFDHECESRFTGIQHPPRMADSPKFLPLFNNKSRHQLLERRVVSLEAFQKEVDQCPGTDAVYAKEGSIVSAIPVPLYQSESMGLYDHRFWTWLMDYGETKKSLRSYPLSERQFRMTFAFLRINRPQGLFSAIEEVGSESQTTLAPRPSIEAHTKIPVGIVKSARSHLAMDQKKPVDTIKRQVQAAPDEPSSKRARIDAKGVSEARVTADVSSSRSAGGTEQKHKLALSLVSPNQALPRSSSVPAFAPSTEASSTAPIANISSSAGPVHLSILPQTAPENWTIQAEVETACIASISTQKKQINTRAKRLTALAQKTKSGPATSSNSVAISTKTAGDMAATAGKMACFDKGLPSVPMEKPVEPIALSENKAATQQTATSLVIRKPLTLQAKLWDQRIPESKEPSPKPDPSATRLSPSPSVPTESPADLVPATAAALLIRVPPYADVSLATTITKVNPSINATTNDSADTDPAEAEPDIVQTESVAQEVSQAGSDPADESEHHDGDVMNRDGCCCVKCMRSWAKTLTDRMDQLEQTVLGLKRQFIGQGGARQ